MIGTTPNPTPAGWAGIDWLRELVNACKADVDQLHGRIVALEAEVVELKAGRPAGRSLAEVRALHPSTHGLPDGAA